MSETAGKHPIQVVARRTGLTADTIRAWERRYGVVRPERAAGGRRLYTEADVDRLALLYRAVRGGRRISDLTELALPDLAALVEADEQAVERHHEPPPPLSVEQGDARTLLEECSRAVRELDANGLRKTLIRASVELPPRAVMEQIVAPLTVSVGEAWHSGSLRVAHEHMASHVLRTFLADMLAKTNRGTGPRVLITTPSGQLHEIGALMAAVLAAGDGWRVTYLGADTPMTDVAGVAAQGFRAVALSIVYPPDDPYLADDLRLLRQHLPESTAIVVGGSGARFYEAYLEAVGAMVAGSMDEWLDALSRLRGAE